jgi:hypothetical protein
MISLTPNLRSLRGLRCSGAADGRHERVDVGILADDFRDGFLILDHLVIGSALRGFGDDGELVGVLIGNESFGDFDE